MSRRHVLRLVAAGIVVGLATVAALVYEPWLPLRYGRLDPPEPVRDGLEAPLERRIRQLTADITADSYSADAWGRLGVVFDVHDLQHEAIVCYERAHRLDPAAFAWVYFLGICKLDSDHLGALAHLETAARLIRDYAPLELHLARGYFDAERLDEAVAHYRRAAALDPALVRPSIGLARVALVRGTAQEAVGHLETALALGPRTGEAHLLLAEAHRRLGNDDDAARHAALAGDRRQFEDFSDVIRARSQWDAGVTMFWRSTRSARYLQEGMIEEAAAEWTALLREDPTSIRACLELARVYEAARALPPAIAAYERALRLDPDLDDVRHRLGVALCREGRLPEGIDHLRRAARARPGDAAIRGNLARALGQAGRHAEAAGILETLLRNGNDDVDVLNLLAWLRATCPDPAVRDGAEALRLIEPACRSSSYGDPRLLDTLAAAHAETGNFEEAVRYAQRAIDLVPATPARAARLELYQAGRPYRSGQEE